jgi:predicted acylesterase/phospholipase RssA
VRCVCVLGVSALLGCTLTRRDAPPTLFSSATPVGFPATVRFLSVDRATVEARSDAALQGLRKASKDGVVRFLALSGGGAAGAFGAGALLGLSHRHERPQYDLVTGVSAGALIAPFAFLGPEWDSQLADSITSGRGEQMTLHGLTQLLFGTRHRSDTLLSFVDHYITQDLVDAVAREAASGRILWVATTDLDKEELVIWDMGIIAQHGGEPARRLFRDVLVASASVPGVFSPVLIHVEKGGVQYDEMHVDGNASASLFVAPAAAYFAVLDQSALQGAQLYVLINGKIIGAPSTTHFKLGPILGRSFDAAMKHLSRGQVIAVNQFADKYHMSVYSTYLPFDYPPYNSADFHASAMRVLFNYGERCAEQGRLWTTLDQTMAAASEAAATQRTSAPDQPPQCPLRDVEQVHASSR